MLIQITTPGEKLKEMRKQLKLNQIDLASKDLSRSLISLFENNHLSINSKNSEILYSNLIRHSENRCILLLYSYDAFCKSIKEQLIENTTFSINHLNSLMNSSNKVIKKSYLDIQKFAQLESIPFDYKYKLFETISDYESFIENNEMAFYYIEKSFDYVLMTNIENEKIRITNKVLRLGLILRKNHLLKYTDLVNKYLFPKIDLNLMIYYFNSAIVLKLDHEYKASLETINKINIDLILEPNKLAEIILFKANLNETLGDYKTAISYLDQLNNFESEEFKIVSCINKINIFLYYKIDIDLGNKELKKFKNTYLIPSDRVFDICSDRYRAGVYYYLAKFYNISNDDENSFKYTMLSINNLNSTISADLLKELYSFSVLFFYNNNAKSQLDNIIRLIEKSFKNSPVDYKNILKTAYKYFYSL